MDPGAHSPLIGGANRSVGGFLIIETGTLQGQRFLLPKPPGDLLLGRERECNIRFDPHKELLVGKKHARLSVRVDGVYLVDLNSANGTYLNGQAVVGEIRLQHGDRFQLGGEDGPWISLQMPGMVTVTPPRSEVPTLVSPRVNSGPAPQEARQVKREPRQAQEAESELKRPPARPPESFDRPQDDPSTPQHAEKPQRHQAPAVAPTTSHSEPVPADPVAMKQRAQFIQQVAVIALLLVVSCVVGLGISMFSGAPE